jgi:hypothetical protein
MESVGLVESGLPVSSQVEDVAVTLVNVVPLLLYVLHVELLRADQRISLKKKR